MNSIGVNLVKKVQQKRGLTAYKIARALNELGTQVSETAIDLQVRKNAKSMRLDLLSGLRKVAGVSWSEFGRWIDESAEESRNQETRGRK